MAQSEPMQDWCTQSIRDSTPTPEPPKDYNGDVLAVGDIVLMAWGRGALADGKVVDVTTHASAKAVTVQSLRFKDRRITVEASGTIKTNEG